MENGDLKRYYKVNNQETKDFARLNADGKIDKDLLPSDVGTTVVANPTGTATDDLTKLQVEDTIYAIPEGTEVVANPTLAGTEAALNGLQVGDTKYKVEAGSEIHTYTYGTISDTTLVSQLRDDITNKRNIIIGDNLYTYIHYVSTNKIATYRLVYPNGATGIQLEDVYIRDYTSQFTMSGSAVGVDKTTANPTLAGTESNLTGIEVGATKYKLGYLPLEGGTLTGNVLMIDSTKIKVKSGGYEREVLLCNYSGAQLGNSSSPTQLNSNNTSIYHNQAGASYIMLDTGNTSANPGNTTASLTSLKLNGTNYAIAGGTQVTFVDWS